MPKKTPNYAQSCIYKLCCKNPLVKEEYVGSTTSFRKRKNQHKTVCTNEKDKRFNCRVYKHIRANGGWENWDMVEVANVDAIDKRDLERIERTYIESLGAALNCSIPTRSAKERYIQNRAEKLEYQSKYYQDNTQAKFEYQCNKERRQAYNKQYQAANKDRLMHKVCKGGM